MHLTPLDKTKSTKEASNMIKSKNFKFMFVLLSGFCAFLLLPPGNSQAALFTIDQVSDQFTVGGFIVAGGADKSSPGQVFEVLGGPTNDLHNTPDESGSRNSSMGALWSILNGAGITNATSLVFGFGLDETGSPGSNPVNIASLVMTFNRPLAPPVTFSLGDNTVSVYGNQGASGSEARFQVDLPFDFMTTFSATSTQMFTISSTINGTDDGPEIYFLDAGFTANPPAPVPEPTTILLLGAGLLGLWGARKKFRK
jgi:hypothetical protein